MALRTAKRAVLGRTEYALAPLTDWTSEMASYWEARFDDLENLLTRMDQ